MDGTGASPGQSAFQPADQVQSNALSKCKAESAGIPFVEVPRPAHRRNAGAAKRRFRRRCPSGPTGAACAASSWTATRTRPETCCVAACASSQEPRQPVGRRKALPWLPQRVTCRSRRPFGQRLRCTEGGSRKQNRKNQAHFLRARLLQVPHEEMEGRKRRGPGAGGDLGAHSLLESQAAIWSGPLSLQAGGPGTGRC